MKSLEVRISELEFSGYLNGWEPERVKTWLRFQLQAYNGDMGAVEELIDSYALEHHVDAGYRGAELVDRVVKLFEAGRPAHRE